MAWYDELVRHVGALSLWMLGIVVAAAVVALVTARVRRREEARMRPGGRAATLDALLAELVRHEEHDNERLAQTLEATGLVREDVAGLGRKVARLDEDVTRLDRGIAKIADQWTDVDRRVLVLETQSRERGRGS